MNTKIIMLPALLLSLLAGCASTSPATSNDPVRARVLAELEQAKADGSYPITEAHYANLPVERSERASARVVEAKPATVTAATAAP